MGLHCSFKSCLRRSSWGSTNAPGLWLNSWWSDQCECAPNSVSELNDLKDFSTAVEATEVLDLHWQMYCGMCSMWRKCLDWLYICQISCSQRDWTAVLVAAAGGHLDLVRELVEQHGAELLHKSNVSSASFCVWFRLWVTSVMCTYCLCDSSH